MSCSYIDRPYLNRSIRIGITLSSISVDAKIVLSLSLVWTGLSPDGSVFEQVNKYCLFLSAVVHGNGSFNFATAFYFIPCKKNYLPSIEIFFFYSVATCVTGQLMKQRSMTPAHKKTEQIFDIWHLIPLMVICVWGLHWIHTVFVCARMWRHAPTVRCLSLSRKKSRCDCILSPWWLFI